MGHSAAQLLAPGAPVGAAATTTKSNASAASTARLGEQPAGSTVVVDHLDGALDATAVRLMEMGLVPGAVVTITRAAPFGDPLEIAVCGTRLCLRRLDARRFVVVDGGAM
jgi:Fe2+ transport system protein FeoA